MLEEIVGEISDEYESAPEKIITLKQGGWLVDATVPLDDLSMYSKYHLKLKMLSRWWIFKPNSLQRLPKKGERINYSGSASKFKRQALPCWTGAYLPKMVKHPQNN